MKDFDEAVAKMKVGHEYTQRQLLATANAQKVTAEALASMQESNAELIKVVTKMCNEMQQGMQVVMRELAVRSLAAQKPPQASKATSMKVQRDDDGRITGATIQ